MSRTRYVGGAGVVALIFLCGCPKALVERPEPPPTAEKLVAHLRERASQVTTQLTEAKVDYLAERGSRIKLTMTFLTDRAAGGLRIDAESPMGGTVASLASDGKEFQLLDSRDNRFLVGEATPCNLARLIRLRLNTADLIDAITGGAPLFGEPTEVRWDGKDGGHEVLMMKSADGSTETVELTPKTWDVASAEVRSPNGKVVYRLRHEDFVDDGGVRFPDKTVIEDPDHRADAKIRVRSRQQKVTPPAGAFHLSPPPGIAVETVSCSE